MTITALITCLVLVAMAVGQIGMTALYVRRCRSYHTPVLADSELRTTVVVLSLRGGDESLGECLEELLHQDYPRYRLSIVVDHPTDPAATQVNAWLAKHPGAPVKVEYLHDPSPWSHLKSNSLAQAVAELDDDVEWIALIDADVYPYRRWLRDLVSPLAAAGVGVVTGNRWYFPRTNEWGAWVRFVYNGCAVPPMYSIDATWGGSLAMKRAVFDRPVFREQIRRTSCEDLAITRARLDACLKLAFTPAVMMWSNEGCSLGSCYRFITRQLVWTRLYLASWRWILLHAGGMFALLVGASLSGLAALGLSRMDIAAWLLGGVAAYWMATVSSLAWLHSEIRRRLLSDQQRVMPGLSLAQLARVAVSLAPSLFTYSLAVLRAALMRRLDWRGITYEVLPPDGIRMTEYRPFGQVQNSNAGKSKVSATDMSPMQGNMPDGGG